MRRSPLPDSRFRGVQKTESAERRLRLVATHARPEHDHRHVQKTESAERRLRHVFPSLPISIFAGCFVQKTESAERRLRP